MKISLVFLINVACVFGAALNAESGHNVNGLAALLAEHGGMVEMTGTRIVGGQLASIARFPWTLSIQRTGSHRCGATIISHNRALTAAHCVTTLPVSGMQLRAGSALSHSGGQMVPVSQIVIHPQYHSMTLNNDIAVMSVFGSFSLGSAGIAAIGLPAQGAGVATGAAAYVAGWGATCERCPESAQLRYVQVPIVAQALCNQLYNGDITPGMICAGLPEGGRDSCQGDSGGPLNVGGQLVGVVSWGAGCARPNLPGVYARVAFYRNWINSLL